jgi:outer membrane protein
MTRFFQLFFVFSALGCYGQKAWTLQECINYAKERNISLKQAEIANEINLNNTMQSRAQVLPSVNAGASHNYNFGKTIDRYTNKFADSRVLSQNFFITSNLVIWSGMSQYNTIKSNEYNYLSGVERLKQQENDLSLNIAGAYISVIFAEELLKISRNQFEITKEQLDRTLKMVSAGALAKSVEYDLRAQMANEELNVTTADNNFTIAMLNLRQLMNLDSISNFSLTRPEAEVNDLSFSDIKIETVYQTALNNQPSIKSGEYASLSAQRSLAASKGRWSPTLSLNASMGTGTSELNKDIQYLPNIVRAERIGYTSKLDSVYAPVFETSVKDKPFLDQFNENINKTIGLTLTIPLFNGLQTHTAVKNAKLGVKNAQLTQELNRQNLYKSIAQAFADAKAAFNKFTASKISVEAASQSFAFAQQKFNAGAISSFDFSTAKNRLFAAESNLLQARYDYIFKLKVLDYYQGKPLGF